MRKIIIESATIAKKIKLSPNHFILKLKIKNTLSNILPGQFVNIRLQEDNKKILRRPFSIFDIDEERNYLSLFIKQIGEGTKYIINKSKNDTVDVIYPLGNNFEFTDNNRVLLVGGGFGVAPLFFLSKHLVKKNNIIHLLVGADTANNIHLLDFFDSSIKIYITTEDGSLGIKGKLTHHSVLNKYKFDKIYTCGPLAMMKKISLFANKHNVDCQVSLDNFMACGIGTCLSCVVKTKDGNERSCIEGPVFDTKNLLW